MRLKASKNINFRGSVSTEFHAPSLTQIYYNLHFTNFNTSDATEVLLAPNDSLVTKAFGIQKLNEEKAVNASLGFTANFGDFTATVDGYFIKVKNRIVLTGYFDAAPLNIGDTEAQFFVNGVDTKTTGLDLVLAWKKKFGLNLNYARQKFDADIAFTHFSKVVLVDYGDEDDVYHDRIVTDLTLRYQLTKSLKLSVGSNNLFNVYPPKQDEQGNTEAGGYWDTVQIGFSGGILLHQTWIYFLI